MIVCDRSKKNLEEENMTLQQRCDTKEQAKAVLLSYRDAGFTGKIVSHMAGNRQGADFMVYDVYVGGFGSRYKNMKKNA